MKRPILFITFGFSMVVAFILMAAEIPKEGSTLHDLKNIDELKSAFNEDKGDPRLLVLLSPT